MDYPHYSGKQGGKSNIKKKEKTTAVEGLKKLEVTTVSIGNLGNFSSAMNSENNPPEPEPNPIF
jgi:hypothetical protein